MDVDLVHVYDPVTDAWSEVAPLPRPRSHFEPGTFVVDGKIVLVDGKSLTNTCIDDVTIYDTLTDTWSEFDNTPDCLLASSAKVVNNTLCTYLMAGKPTYTISRSRP